MMILVAVISIYSIEDDELENIKLKTLSNAIYQVLKENKLEEFIKGNM